MLSRVRLCLEVEKKGKVSYSVWSEAKQLNVDPESLRKADEEFRQHYQQELRAYASYVRDGVRPKSRPRTPSPSNDVAPMGSGSETIQLLKSFVLKNQYLGLEMPDGL